MSVKYIPVSEEQRQYILSGLEVLAIAADRVGESEKSFELRNLYQIILERTGG